ncbi:type II toxin-antitoxin system RelE/ParE family toxin [Aurantimonas sp. 22II-16-19i]|uniref:type II toxin-antitoxin system RelE/ParE family toxin n=1 Tax=Aurantimonas sp. 22II-16-19i TaxID=1317114 RepID=UPI001FD914E8|nr:type II toxin-antitoxin system RelE/ParE family toxin [Aurantimonas sp. 22II-16-19i]
MDVFVTPSAIADLDKLHRYIAGQSSEERADGYIARIQAYLRGSRRSRNGAPPMTICWPACARSASSVVRRLHSS